MSQIYLPGASDASKVAKVIDLTACMDNADAQFGLGVMYSKGHGVPQDYAAAASWFRKAADHVLT